MKCRYLICVLLSLAALPAGVWSRCASTGAGCITWSSSSCQGQADGNYQACEGCTFFHTCLQGVIFANRSCPLTSSGGLNGKLVWNARDGYCDFETTTCTECAVSASRRDSVPEPCHSGPTCITSSPTACESLPYGDYQACEGCTYYHSCYEQVNYAFRPCPSGLVWVADSFSQGHCDYTTDTCHC